MKEYYAAVMQAPDLELDRLTMQHQLANRQRVLKERNALEQTARYLECQNPALHQQVNQLRQQVHRLDSQTVPLETVAARLGV